LIGSTAAFAVLVEILEPPRRHREQISWATASSRCSVRRSNRSDAAQQAVAAAREMLAANERLNKQTSWPLRIGIGIHVGEVVAGNIGLAAAQGYHRDRRDTVNFCGAAGGAQQGSRHPVPDLVRPCARRWATDCKDAVSRATCR